MKVIKEGAWSTDYTGADFRIVTVDLCEGSNVTECHHVQYENESFARCLNGSFTHSLTQNEAALQNTVHITDADAMEREIMTGESNAVIRKPRESGQRFSYRPRKESRDSNPIPPVNFSHE